jgi:predicted amidophosphoribosyltransferase
MSEPSEQLACEFPHEVCPGCGQERTWFHPITGVCGPCTHELMSRLTGESRAVRSEE